MIRLEIMPLLEKKGKTKYWLYKQMGGMSYQNLCKIASGKAKAIHFETLETLCQVLECTPNDLFVIDPEQPEGPPGNS